MGRLSSARSGTRLPAAVLLGVATGACASTPRESRVDLAPARDALEAARQAGAPERAVDTFTRAEGHLNEAEALVRSARGHGAVEKARQAEWLARLATVEAQCAAGLALLDARGGEANRASATAAAELEQLRSRLRRAEDAQRRLEERSSLLQRDLDFTETEVIRTKARLKGLETKAEASSAVAEARILMRRLEDHGGSADTLARCREQLARAEQLLREDNYGAAIFFAMKAQDTAARSRAGDEPRTPDAAAVERPAPRSQYTVRVSRANVRAGPGTGEVVLARAAQGATLTAVSVRGDWIKVTLGDVTGWVHRSTVR